MIGETLNNQVFAVGEKTFCVWGFGLNHSNQMFIRGIDPEYFQYQAETHEGALAGKHKRRAALALQSAYFHGIETLFTLIFACIYAPGALSAWILKCKTEDLRSLVATVNGGTGKLHGMLILDAYTWEVIAQLITAIALKNRERLDEQISQFTQLWAEFGKDYVNAANVDAFNSIKHGFRVSLGGMKVSFGGGKGQAPAMDLGESEFGLCFNTLVDFKQRSSKSIKTHMRMKWRHVNSHPHYMANALRLISISIYNIKVFLHRLGGDGNQVGKTPEGDNWFDSLVKLKDGLMELAVDTNLSEKDIASVNDAELLKEYDGQRLTVKFEKSPPPLDAPPS